MVVEGFSLRGFFKLCRCERGFSLVELAITVSIVGIILIGVVKGQEVINNARATAMIAEVKSIKSAISSFNSTYGSYPGDILNVALLSCGNCVAGTGNRRVIIDQTAAEDGTVNPNWDTITSSGNTTETFQFWRQLGVTELITNVTVGSNTNAFGSSHPVTRMGGGYDAFFDSDFRPNAVNIGSTGHFLRASFGAIGNVWTRGVTSPFVASSIDRKIDDGLPYAGQMMAAGAGCAPTGTGTTAASGYTRTNENEVCTLYFKFGGRRG